ncbi:flagellar biosynthetic protein FliO [Pistricoccus aurantiacus]|uniref:flagellar biosynthetic protein FliO n=1 Tax=Pistricoccus aurantiacus TaxID=1883414 RepID=UPI00362BAC01
MSAKTENAQQAMNAIQSSDSLLGLAALGKVALSLALIIGLILLVSRLMRRLRPGQANAAKALKVVAGTAVGNRERVVIVEVANTWLVLGVGGGQVNKLHDMPAPEPDPAVTTGLEGESFAQRFAGALKHNALKHGASAWSEGKKRGRKKKESP